MPHPRRRLILMVVAAFALTAVAGITFLLGGRILRRDDGAVRADAIVVLAGELPTRAVEAALLYKAGVASRVISTNEKIADGLPAACALGIDLPTQNELNDRILTTLGVPGAAILHYPEVTVATRDEVAAIARLLGAHPEIRSLLLVTNGYHSARARRYFARCLPGITVSVHPPRHEEYDHLHPWRRPWDVKATVIELLISFAQLFSGCPSP